MSDQPIQTVRVVYDCMVYGQAIINDRGPAWACIELAQDGRVQLFWSDYVLQEIKELPTKLPVRLKVTLERVETFIRRVSPFIRHVSLVPENYTNPFDADDSHYINLADVCGATIVTSRDRDLLRLMDANQKEGQEFRGRFPTLEIITPVELLHRVRAVS